MIINKWFGSGFVVTCETHIWRTTNFTLFSFVAVPVNVLLKVQKHERPALFLLGLFLPLGLQDTVHIRGQ